MTPLELAHRHIAEFEERRKAEDTAYVRGMLDFWTHCRDGLLRQQRKG